MIEMIQLGGLGGRRLGRLTPKVLPHLSLDPHVLQFRKYLRAAALPPVIPYIDWFKPVTPKMDGGWGMMLNDQIGDCTCAAVGHAVQLLTGVTGNPVTPSDGQVAQMYRASGWNGFVNDPSDQGWLISDALAYWQKYGLAGHKIAGRIAIDPTNALHVDLAIEIFGFVNIGIQLPVSAQGQTGIWTVPPTGTSGIGAPGSWGGHSVIVAGRSPNVRRLCTWGQADWIITPNAWLAYVNECWAVFSEDWLRNGKSPAGFARTEMVADWKVLQAA